MKCDSTGNLSDSDHPRQGARKTGSRAPLFGLIMLLAFSLTPPLAGAPDLAKAAAKKIEQSLYLLDRYLKSDTAHSIADGDNQAAKLLLERATSKREQAEQSFATGNLNLSQDQLDEAMNAYQEASNIARKGSAPTAEILLQNNNIRAEISAYRTAYDQAVLSKGPAASGMLNTGLFSDLLNKSTELESNGDPLAAQATLREAYNQIVAALVRVRQNETVVYGLDFRTPADEYRYEQKRFESYSLLLSQRIEQVEVTNKTTMNMADRYRELADENVSKAEQQANSGDYETAIKTMEEANRNLLRALRMTGMVIPG